MKKKTLYSNFLKVLTLTVTTLIFIPILEAQTHRPRKLREEILKEQKKQAEKSTPTKTTRKSRGKQPPQVGATVLKPANPKANKNATLIHLERSYELLFDQKINPNLQILKGNVLFRHDDALLYCDSAYFDDLANTFDAFGHVRIVQADTLTVYGDYLNYDGNTKMARLWDNVKMVNRNTVLTTDILYYDRAVNLAFYNTGGVVQDGNNTLTSMWGQYSPATKTALFKDQVKMTNPDATMTTDTLKYNTDTSVADIVGNSLVVYKEETDIYSQRGWYDTKNDRMMLLDRSLVEQNDGKTLVGDTIFYDKNKKYAEAFSKVELNDPDQKATLYGNFVSYDEIKQVGLASDSALFVDWSSRDSLFLSADTLYSMKDSIETDSIAYNKLQAFKNVRFLRSDAQGMCDSLIYNTRDSIMHLRGLPVLWSDNNQMMGNKMTAFTKNQKIDRILIEQSAIAIQKDSLYFYNQMSGKEVTAYLDDGEMKHVYVNGNAETIYFPKDDKTNEYIGVNKTVSSYVNMYFKEKKIDRIVLTTASSGVMYPIRDMGKDDLYLRNFYWYEKERPGVVDDLFTHFERVEPPKRPESDKKPTFPGGGATNNTPSTQPRTNNQNSNSTRSGSPTNHGSNRNSTTPMNRGMMQLN
ncbi:MAG: OstA-like protein [Paludibacteraceae bacterium]